MFESVAFHGINFLETLVDGQIGCWIFQYIHLVNAYDVFQCIAGDSCDVHRPVVRRIGSRSFLVHWDDTGMLLCWYSSLVKICLVDV